MSLEQRELAAEWMGAARRGDFARAWQISDRALQLRVGSNPCWHLPRHEQWVWDGRPVAGRRVLVRCYHGLGDTLQFARFLPMLARLAREVIVWAQPPLIPLLRSLDAPLELLALHEDAPDVDFDVDIELMEVPHALRLDPTAACRVPYVSVPPAARRCDGFSIGLVARAGDFDPSRSVPECLLTSALADLPVALFSLQLGGLPGTTDISSTDVLTVASRVQALDLVISVDTMMAHLAGALGVPTWTLLPKPADWRWMQDDRTDTPWYPSMRLFRQPNPGDWPTVLADVRRGLSGGVQGRAQRPPPGRRL